MIQNYPIVAFILFFILSGSLAAQDQPADTPGSEDHPMVTRYEGSFIDGYEIEEFDEYVLALGPTGRDEGGNLVASERAVLQGRITRILYRGPDERSSLEILHNYMSALEGAGFEVLFSCGSDCGNNFSTILYGPMELRIRNTGTSGSAFDIPQDVRYLAARLEEGERTVHISLLTAFDNGFSELSKRPVTLLEIIEAETMDTGMVTVDAQAIGEGIDHMGHMAIYGIHFDTDSASIKPGSSPVLDEIALLLNQRPDLKILIVGHTDNQGSYEYNIGLSSRRANSVARHLEENHGIDGERLRAEGVGFLAPVASNDTSNGRSKNRRVELVKQ